MPTIAATDTADWEVPSGRRALMMAIAKTAPVHRNAMTAQ
jgi:hypothetical protein